MLGFRFVNAVDVNTSEFIVLLWEIFFPFHYSFVDFLLFFCSFHLCVSMVSTIITDITDRTHTRDGPGSNINVPNNWRLSYNWLLCSSGTSKKYTDFIKSLNIFGYIYTVAVYGGQV